MKILIYNKRIEKHLSQRDLAELSGVGRASISRIESGLQSPTLDTLVLLAKALNCKVTELFSEDD